MANAGTTGTGATRVGHGYGNVGLAGVGKPEEETNLASYPFTANLLDTVNGYALTADVDPTPSPTGIALVSATNGKIPSTGWPVNDYQITFTILFNETPATTAAIMENEYSVSTDTNLCYMKSSNLFTILKWPSNTEISLASAGDTNGRTFDVVWIQSSTDGLTLTVDEVGGSSFSGTVNNATANGKANVAAWTGYMELGQRGALYELDYSLKDFKIKEL